MSSYRIFIIGLVPVILAACSTLSEDAETTNDQYSIALNAADAIGGAGTASDIVGASTVAADPPEDTSIIVEYRAIPNFGDAPEEVIHDAADYPEFRDGELSVLIPPQPIPEFIDTVFGELLELGYTLDNSVAKRREIVTYRSAPNISREELYDSAQATLLSYGIALSYEDGQLTAIEEDRLLRQSPRFIRARARASVPSNLRPIAKYVQPRAISVPAASSILKQVFTEKGELTIYGMDRYNAMILTGLPPTIERAEEIIASVDEIRHAESNVATLRIRNWDLSELAETLEDQLSFEGFSVSSTERLMRAINLFPIEYTNQLVIIAADKEQLAYAIATAERLDESARVERDIRANVYKAKYYEAGELIDILTGQILRSQNSGVTTGSAAAAPGTLASPSTTRNGISGAGGTFDVNFSVDQQGNRLIYMASEEQDREIRSLLRLLDTPQDEVLIDVTIAEVTLTDDTSYGLEFLMSQIGSQGYSLGFGTGGGIGLTTGGLSGQYASGDYTINFSALSSNNQINVLSSPRLVVKSGTLGSIQVGTDVPIITSQAAANTQISGTTDVLQRVEYRETGILLDIQPLVLSNDRIDIKISQEVSSAEENANQAISSPVISNRKIQTELTLQDGQSAILGGLIENRYTRGSTGVPLAKDIPILGNLFKTETLNSTRTMLLVMITPYVLSSREDREANVRTLTEAMNEAFQNQVNESRTLVKPNDPFQIPVED